MHPMADLLGIGSLVQGLGNIFGSSQEAKVAKENTDKTIAANRQMAEYEFSKNLEMWNKGNTYNAPMAQMDRLKKAGLNPNLVYGNGASAGAVGQLPKYTAPQTEYNYKPPVDLGVVGGALNQGIMAHTDMQIRNAQLDNLRAQRSAINQETINKGITESILGQKEMMGRTARDYFPDVAFEQLEKMKLANQQSRNLMPFQLQGMQEKNRQLAQQNSYLLAQTENKKLQNEYFLGTNFGGLGINALKSLGSVGKFFLGNKTIKATKPALRVNPNNWPKFKHD